MWRQAGGKFQPSVKSIVSLSHIMDAPNTLFYGLGPFSSTFYSSDIDTVNNCHYHMYSFGKLVVRWKNGLDSLNLATCIY
jgi:hypothetical protein